jgi:hypothetical protein
VGRTPAAGTTYSCRVINPLDRLEGMLDHGRIDVEPRRVNGYLDVLEDAPPDAAAGGQGQFR